MFDTFTPCAWHDYSCGLVGRRFVPWREYLWHNAFLVFLDALVVARLDLQCAKLTAELTRNADQNWKCPKRQPWTLMKIGSASSPNSNPKRCAIISTQSAYVDVVEDFGQMIRCRPTLGCGLWALGLHSRKEPPVPLWIYLLSNRQPCSVLSFMSYQRKSNRQIFRK